MGQYDLLECMRELKDQGHGWNDVKKLKDYIVKNKGYSPSVVNKIIYDDLYKLVAFGLAEMKGVGVWNHKKLFRVKGNNGKLQQ